MKIATTCILLLFFPLTLQLALCLPATAQKGTGDKGGAKKELEELENAWAAAVETNDPKRIGQFFMEDFLFVGARGILQDRQQHLEDFRSGRLKVESVKIEQMTIHVYDGSAVVSSRVMVKGKFAGRDITGPYQFTDTWVKQAGRWLAAARQQTGIAQPGGSPVVKEFFAAFGKGDLPTVLNTLSPDVDWFIPGPPAIPYAGAKHGRDEVNDFFKKFLGSVDVVRFEPQSFVEESNKVVVLGFEDLRVKVNGNNVHNDWAMVFTVEKGKISKFRSYEDTAALVAAFSLPTKPLNSKKLGQPTYSSYYRAIGQGVPPSRQVVDDDFKTFDLGDFRLRNGVTLPKAKLTYATWGTLNKAKTNAVLCPSHYAADHHGYDYLIGPGLALDPSKDFIIATNMFANGLSSSPSNTPPPFQGPQFPDIAIVDNVTAVNQLLTKQFGISKLKAVVGFSMGGQQAYQWAVSYPDKVASVVIICSNARQYPFGVVRLEGAKAALTADAAWNQGNYKLPPEKGLRALGSHWAAWIFSQQFWRTEAHLTVRKISFAEQLKRLQEAFLDSDANDLLSQANTWQQHDIAKTPGFEGDLIKALQSIQARVLLMPSTSDQYFPLGDMQQESLYIANVRLKAIQSVWGHPAGGGSDPIATEFVNRQVRQFLDN
jgi:homoserine O-acetyltransferase